MGRKFAVCATPPLPQGNDDDWSEWQAEMDALKKGLEQLNMHANYQTQRMAQMAEGWAELDRLNQNRLNGLQQQISEEKDIRHNFWQAVGAQWAETQKGFQAVAETKQQLGTLTESVANFVEKTEQEKNSVRQHLSRLDQSTRGGEMWMKLQGMDQQIQENAQRSVGIMDSHQGLVVDFWELKKQMAIQGAEQEARWEEKLRGLAIQGAEQEARWEEKLRGQAEEFRQVVAGLQAQGLSSGGCP